MPTRNTGVLNQIIEALGDHARPDALERLEDHFKDSLLIVAGNTQTVASSAEELRLAITTHECGLVLDHLARQVRITIDQTDEAINALSLVDSLSRDGQRSAFLSMRGAFLLATNGVENLPPPFPRTLRTLFFKHLWSFGMAA